MAYWDEERKELENEWGFPYLVRNQIKIAVDEMSRANYVSVQRSSVAIVASWLAECFKENLIQ